MGPFKIIDRTTRRWLWAHSRISTKPLGGGYGPIQEHRHCRFGGPIQEHRHRRFGGPIRDNRQNHSAVAVGPFEIIDRTARRWLWAHSRILTQPLGGGCGPIREYRHNHSVVAAGPFKNIDIADSVGLFKKIDRITRWWLWAHSRITTSPIRWAHSRQSTQPLGGGCGPIREY